MQPSPLSIGVLLLPLAATVGSISPSGKEVEAFLSLEQAILPQTTPDGRRTATFPAYNVVSSLAGALGALAAGLPTEQPARFKLILNLKPARPSG